MQLDTYSLETAGCIGAGVFALGFGMNLSYGIQVLIETKCPCGSIPSLDSMERAHKTYCHPDSSKISRIYYYATSPGLYAAHWVRSHLSDEQNRTLNQLLP